METTKRYYAGIGSRETPACVQENMTKLAEQLGKRAWRLRSGGAKGADQAFERGADLTPFPSESFNAYHKYFSPEILQETLSIAKSHHPAWTSLNEYVKKLMMRNVLIVLGAQLNEPASFLLYWTPNGTPVGGTGHSIRVARAHNIPCVCVNRETKLQELVGICPML